MTEKVIEQFDGRLVKVLFRDGNQIRSIRGELKPFESDFLRVRTLTQDFLINKTDIIKIQIPNADGDSDERE